MSRSVVSNWAWSLLVMVSGFIVPRLIDDRLGKDLLGIWDLGWSLVIYVRWLQIGIAGSISRYVARYRAIQDWTAFNEAVNSALAVVLCSSALGAAFAVSLYWLAPLLLTDLPAALVDAARVTAVLLALSAVTDTFGSAVNSIHTGCERFDILNIIRCGRDGLLLAGMIALLALGFGIPALAWLTLLTSLAATAVFVVSARWICRELRYSSRYARWPVAREMIVFGGKSVVQTTSRSALYQVNALLVAAYLGPAALAVFSRQRALVLQALSFVKQYAQVFVPRSSALHARGDERALQELLILSSKYGLYVTLPAIVAMLTMGGPLLNVWMGPGYEAPWVLAALALGHAFSVPQQGVFMMLVGMNQHGRIAIYEFVTATVSIGLGWLALGPLQLHLMGAALAIALPIAIGAGVFMPVYACRLLHLPVLRYFRAVSAGPLLASIPLATCLLLGRLCAPGSDVIALLVGAAAGGLTTLLVYWRWVLPAQLKRRLRAKLIGNRNDKALADWPRTVSSPNGGPHA